MMYKVLSKTNDLVYYYLRLLIIENYKMQR